MRRYPAGQISPRTLLIAPRSNATSGGTCSLKRESQGRGPRRKTISWMSWWKNTATIGHWSRRWWQIAIGIKSKIDSTVSKTERPNCKTEKKRRYTTSRTSIKRSSKSRQLRRSMIKILRMTKSKSNPATVAMEIYLSIVWLRSRTVCRISRKSRQVAHPTQKVTVVSGGRTAWKMGRQVLAALYRARESSTLRIRSQLKTVAPLAVTTLHNTRWSSASLARWGEENNWK